MSNLEKKIDEVVNFQQAYEFWTDPDVSNVFYTLFPQSSRAYTNSTKFMINTLKDVIEEGEASGSEDFQPTYPIEMVVARGLRGIGRRRGRIQYPPEEEKKIREEEEAAAAAASPIQAGDSILQEIVSTINGVEEAILYMALTPKLENFLNMYLLLISNWWDFISSFPTEQVQHAIYTYLKEKGYGGEDPATATREAHYEITEYMKEYKITKDRASAIHEGRLSLRDMVSLLRGMRSELERVKAYKPAVFSVSEMYLNSLDEYFKTKKPGASYGYKDFRKRVVGDSSFHDSEEGNEDPPEGVVAPLKEGQVHIRADERDKE
ncbi:MAG: hypothetical protein LC687_04195 [Actinobacteria bacterium]|nr:hypothetical protein [Actinomycetota bacterium]MCA1807036.1 hypothetical protein [Actinomycetota bacterium]